MEDELRALEPLVNAAVAGALFICEGGGAYATWKLRSSLAGSGGSACPSRTAR